MVKLEMCITQVKADLIHQREIELLVPASGPGASDVLRLLRPGPATLTSTNASASIAVVPWQKQKLPRKMSSIAEASFSKSAETLEAAAASVFGSSKNLAPTAKSNTEILLGLSCTIGACGEVRAFR
jgi:hypothetical protein